MHPLLRRTGALAAGTTLAALALGIAAQPGAAAPVPRSIVSSTASGGLTYVGTDGANRIEVRVSPITNPAPRFTIDDTAPITATAGCALVPGDETKVTCTAFKNPDGSFKRFHVFGRGGSDTISNFSGVPMNAHGELGRDDLSGGSGPDNLYGGPGDGDDVQGNSGADVARRRARGARRRQLRDPLERDHRHPRRRRRRRAHGREGQRARPRWRTSWAAPWATSSSAATRTT